MHMLGALSQLFRGSPTAVAESFRRHGLGCVELTPGFPGWPFREPGHFTPARCRQVAEAFDEAGVRIACLSSRANLVDVDLDRRHRAIMRLHALLRHCRAFGTDRVVTETGSLSPVSARKSSASSHTAAAWDELRLILKEALAVAADHGVHLLLKPDRGHLIASAEDGVRLRVELAHPALGLVMDPASYLEDCDPAHLARELERLFEQIGPHAPLVHAKDLRYEGGTVTKPRAGFGVLDYGLVLRLLNRHQPDAPIILEHVMPEEVTETKAFLERFLR